MKCETYIPYIDYDSKNAFDYSNEEYSKNYINILYDEYMKYKDIISDITMKSLNNETTMIGSMKNKKNERNYKINYNYYKINTVITDIYGNGNIIDFLIKNFQTGEMFPLILKFEGIEENQDVESEIKMWAKETIKINSSNKLSDSDKIRFSPSKDLKIRTDKNSNAILQECKILDIFSLDEYAITVNKIIFVK